MPEFRRDPLSERWVIIAEDRAGRPSDYVLHPPRRVQGRCPFCAGNEEDTPQAIAVYPSGSRSGSWQVRVIPNRYPAATMSDDACSGICSRISANSGGTELSRVALQDWSGPWFLTQPGLGIHEVIIESPQHVVSFSELSEEQALLSFVAYRDRLRDIRRIPQLSHGIVFKNCRGGGGATLEHAHSQLLATSITPHDVEHELRVSARHFDQSGTCMYCALLRQELEAGVRVVRQTSHFAVYCPFASRFPYESWIVPREHVSRFESSDLSVLKELSELMRTHLDALERLLPDTPYNFWVQTAPLQVEESSFFHWRVQLMPRVTSQAGYEWGTGCFVNPVAPETAAERLRNTAQKKAV